VPHNRLGTLSMVKSRTSRNDSRFFITTKVDAGYLDGKYVGFGRVLEGMDVVFQIESIGGNPPKNSPKKKVEIVNCGLLDSVRVSGSE